MDIRDARGALEWVTKDTSGYHSANDFVSRGQQLNKIGNGGLHDGSPVSGLLVFAFTRELPCDFTSGTARTCLGWSAAGRVRWSGLFARLVRVSVTSTLCVLRSLVR